MIYLYTGTPGSGKSYHAVKDIKTKLGRRSCNRVIANFEFMSDSENFECWDTSAFSVDALIDYAYMHHKSGVENQTLIVIDEAYELFNARDWNNTSGQKGSTRADWVRFFAQHRKYYYNIILIAQADIMIDKQIRKMIEIEVAHFAANNFIWFLPMKAFLYVERWYSQRKKMRQGFIFFRKKNAQLYDTFALFSAAKKAAEAAAQTSSAVKGDGAAVPERTEHGAAVRMS